MHRHIRKRNEVIYAGKTSASLYEKNKIFLILINVSTKHFPCLLNDISKVSKAV